MTLQNIVDKVRSAGGLSKTAIIAEMQEQGLDVGEIRAAAATEAARVLSDLDVDDSISPEYAQALRQVIDALPPAPNADNDGGDDGGDDGPAVDEPVTEPDTAQTTSNNDDDGGDSVAEPDSPTGGTDQPPIEGEIVTEKEPVGVGAGAGPEGGDGAEGFASNAGTSVRVFSSNGTLLPRGRETGSPNGMQAFAISGDDTGAAITTRTKLGEHIAQQMSRVSKGGGAVPVVEFRATASDRYPHVNRQMGLQEQFRQIQRAHDLSMERHQALAELDEQEIHARDWDTLVKIRHKRVQVEQTFQNTGWCSPSVDRYEFCAIPAAWGLFGDLIPTILIERGGTRWPIVPPLASLWGQGIGCETEAEIMEMEDDKPCIELGCPEWSEHRERVCHLCLVSSILTNRTFPEWVTNEVNRFLLMYRYYLDFQKLQLALEAADPLGEDAPLVYDTAGWSVSSALKEKIGFVVDSLAIRSLLNPDSHIWHVLLPFWARKFLKADLEKRSGVDLTAATDAQINAMLTGGKTNIRIHFGPPPWQTFISQSGVAPEDRTWFGSDQSLASGNYPATMEVLVWPEGRYLSGEQDVITLEGQYDYQLLRQNKRLELFTETAWDLFPRCYESARFTLDTCANGRTGAPEAYECPPALPDPEPEPEPEPELANA